MVWRGARPLLVVATVGLVVGGFAGPGFTAPAPSTSGSTGSGLGNLGGSLTPTESAALARDGLTGPGHDIHVGSRGEVDVNICSDTVAPGEAHCDAHLRADLLGHDPEPHATGSDTLGDGGAYGPSFLQSAYDAPSATNGAGQTVAIVDAYDAPNVASDLATYRAHWGLPACTTANGCFEKVDENGGTNYPAADAGWGQEISLDVDMVSAMCPRCHILLVEAADSSFESLGTAVNEAVLLGANVVSNSYGGSEWSGESFYDAEYYDHPGVAIVASTGDSGYGVNYPAASPDVVAVGGTSLDQLTNSGIREATETVWSGAGSGCSAYEPKPVWQTDTGCANRTVADVAADADPNTGVWVYDGGWYAFGGTSVASPIVGALYALAGNGTSAADLSSYPYSHPAALNDVVSGSNGSCGGTYLCTGTVGYDGPTGLGTPNTATAFTPPPAGPSSPTPDFSVDATPVTAPMRPGKSAPSTVTVTPQNSFTGAVDLSAAVSPSAGLSAHFAPSTVTVGATPAPTTLTFTAYKAGVYTVTVTATQGELVHTKVMTVTVNDFTLAAAPASVTVARGKPAKYTLTLTRGGTFTGWIELSVAGLRGHEKVAYSHNPVGTTSATQTMTITTTKLDTPGTVTLHITAASGPLTHTVAVTLVLK